MILGVQWMRQVGPVTLDMKNLTLGVYNNHKQVTLQAGSKPDPTLQI